MTQLSDTAFLQIALQSRYHRYADGLDYVALFGDSMAPLTRDIHASSDDMIADLIILPDGRPVCPGAGIHNSWRYFENSYDAETGDYLDQKKIALKKPACSMAKGIFLNTANMATRFQKGSLFLIRPCCRASPQQLAKGSIWRFGLIYWMPPQHRTRLMKSFLPVNHLLSAKETDDENFRTGLPVYLSCVEYDHSLAANGMEPVPVSILQGKAGEPDSDFLFLCTKRCYGRNFIPNKFTSYGAPTEAGSLQHRKVDQKAM